MSQTDKICRIRIQTFALLNTILRRVNSDLTLEEDKSMHQTRFCPAGISLRVFAFFFAFAVRAKVVISN